MKNAYSVPSRLIGEEVKVRVYDDRLEVFCLGKFQVVIERILGSGSTGSTIATSSGRSSGSREHFAGIGTARICFPG